MQTPASGRAPANASPATTKVTVVPSTTARVLREQAATASRAAAATVSRRRVFHSDEDPFQSGDPFQMPAARPAAVPSVAERASPQARSATTARPRRPRSTETDPVFDSASPLFDQSPQPRALRSETNTTATATRPRVQAHTTPAGDAEMWNALMPEDDPMTATQEALPPAEGYGPPSPPPLFSLRSVSMPGRSLSRGRPEGRDAPPTALALSDKLRGELWASTARAYFDRIDKVTLRTSKQPAPRVTPRLPDAK
jgi:hypothetical protein